MLVIFTSDHGEAFLEHDDIGHGGTLYGEQLRVPLVVQYPDGRRGLDARPASGLDLVPTVLDVAGLAADPDLPGRSLRAPSDPDRVRMAELNGQLRATQSDG